MGQGAWPCESAPAGCPTSIYLLGNVDARHMQCVSCRVICGAHRTQCAVERHGLAHRLVRCCRGSLCTESMALAFDRWILAGILHTAIGLLLGYRHHTMDRVLAESPP